MGSAAFPVGCVWRGGLRRFTLPAQAGDSLHGWLRGRDRESCSGRSQATLWGQGLTLRCGGCPIALAP